MKKKRCHKCGKYKDVSKFHKCKARYDGLQTYCKSCRNKSYKNKEQWELTTTCEICGKKIKIKGHGRTIKKQEHKCKEER